MIVDHEDLIDAAEDWAQAEDPMVDMLLHRFWAQLLNLIHSLDDINHQLERGRYFFTDIVKDGVDLFEEQGYPLADPGHARAHCPTLILAADAGMSDRRLKPGR